MEAEEIDLAGEMADDLEQLRAAHPNRHIEFSRTGDTHGRWDGTRLKPVVRNLVSNADKYGAADTPIRVTILGEVSDVGLEVSNSAGEEPIDRFTGNCPPLKQGLADTQNHDTPGGLGLGLFIVGEIVDAHGGKVEVRSEAGETTFSVHLPRQKPAASP